MLIPGKILVSGSSRIFSRMAPNSFLFSLLLYAWVCLYFIGFWFGLGDKGSLIPRAWVSLDVNDLTTYHSMCLLLHHELQWICITITLLRLRSAKYYNWFSLILPYPLNTSSFKGFFLKKESVIKDSFSGLNEYFFRIF